MPYIVGYIGCDNSSGNGGGNNAATNWENESFVFANGFAENDTINLAQLPVSSNALFLYSDNGPLTKDLDFSIVGDVVTLLYSDPGPITIRAQYEYEL